ISLCAIPLPYVVSSLPHLFSLIPTPPRSTLFPYTTLFRSMNAAMGTRIGDNGGTGAAATFLRREEFAKAGRPELLVFMDVHEDSDRKSTRLNSSHVAISYAVFCLKKKKKS